ncbi:uncharacterized protein METZ01_LOCUS99013, partial [marine metagenome]
PCSSAPHRSWSWAPRSTSSGSCSDGTANSRPSTHRSATATRLRKVLRWPVLTTPVSSSQTKTTTRPTPLPGRRT